MGLLSVHSCESYNSFPFPLIFFYAIKESMVLFKWIIAKERKWHLLNSYHMFNTLLSDKYCWSLFIACSSEAQHHNCVLSSQVCYNAACDI